MSMMAFGPGGFGGRMGSLPDERKSLDGRILRRLFGYLRPQSGAVAASVVFVLASTALSLLGPDLLRIAIDDGVSANDRTTLNLAALAFLGTTAAAWVTSYAGFRLLTTVGQQVLKTLRTEEFAHLQRLSLRFFSRQETGQVMSRVTNDVDAINEFLTAGLVMALLSVFHAPVHTGAAAVPGLPARPRRVHRPADNVRRDKLFQWKSACGVSGSSVHRRKRIREPSREHQRRAACPGVRART